MNQLERVNYLKIGEPQFGGETETLILNCCIAGARTNTLTHQDAHPQARWHAMHKQPEGTPICVLERALKHRDWGGDASRKQTATMQPLIAAGWMDVSGTTGWNGMVGGSSTFEVRGGIPMVARKWASAAARQKKRPRGLGCTLLWES